MAFNILSSGATLFTNFENPLDYSFFNFTKEDDRKCKKPVYIMHKDDDTIIKNAFDWADNYSKEMNCLKSNILIIATTDILLKEMESYAKDVINHLKSYRVVAIQKP